SVWQGARNPWRALATAIALRQHAEVLRARLKEDSPTSEIGWSAYHRRPLARTQTARLAPSTAGRARPSPCPQPGRHTLGGAVVWLRTRYGSAPRCHPARGAGAAATRRRAVRRAR